MDMRRSRRLLLLSGAVLVLAALACNAPGAATPTAVPPTAIPTVAEAAEASPTPVPTAVATDTPVPDVSSPDGCTLNAAYVADVTVPDDTAVDPGGAFTKVWRVRNSGTCPWETGTQLVYVSGDPMGGPTAVDVPPTAPGSNVDVSVDLVAPATPDTYRSTWQLQGPDGVRFGSQVFVQIVVPEQTTEEPTEEPTAEPTETPTGEPTPPDLVITDLDTDTSDPRQGKPLHIVATLRNQGSTTAEDFHWAWRVCVHDGCDYTEAPGTFTLEPGEEVVAQMEYLFGGWANYTTEAWVDSREDVEESEEDNNTRQLAIAVKEGMPDLVVSAMSFNPDPPVQGQDATIKVTVYNRGSKPAESFAVEWWASINAPSPACDWVVIGGLEADDIATLECSYAYPSWYAKITTRAVADVYDDIAESDETNNTLDIETPVEKP